MNLKYLATIGFAVVVASQIGISNPKAPTPDKQPKQAPLQANGDPEIFHMSKTGTYWKYYVENKELTYTYQNIKGSSENHPIMWADSDGSNIAGYHHYKNSNYTWDMKPVYDDSSKRYLIEQTDKDGNYTHDQYVYLHAEIAKDDTSRTVCVSNYRIATKYMNHVYSTQTKSRSTYPNGGYAYIPATCADGIDRSFYDGGDYIALYDGHYTSHLMLCGDATPQFAIVDKSRCEDFFIKP